MTLYTYGYTGGSLEDLQSYTAAGAVILDIRFSPTSRVPRWRKAALAAALGDGYCWTPALGNRNYRGGPVEIVDLVSGLEIISNCLAYSPVVLLCACPNELACHRRYVAHAASEWSGGGLEVIHLRPGQRISQ